MRIAVLVKQVPDTDEVRMDPETGTMIREGVGTVPNPLDLHALEASFVLRERHGGQVTVLSMGPPAADEALREALSLGADEAVLLSDRAFAGSDTWSTALVLAEALRHLGPFDVVLAGEKATDGETGQTGPEVATMLDMPFATRVTAIEEHAEGLLVRRAIEEGYDRQILPLPCLLSVTHELNEPSLPTLSGKKRARRADVQKLDRAALELAPEDIGLAGSPTRVAKIERPVVTRSGKMFGPREIDEGIAEFLRVAQDHGLL